ncbi:hypothetical protein B0F90DRAFT_1665211 [Multifurca ochricompacta]|uniref:Aminoglycoside phosphotransferase domain-containing protein n=1 Tax=Multifurca ochricompacta TaxID=376703 RepID=A0AAD4MD16_9AGAM|nr:hypothetical protein B0F90DRAFT_1665211 [Multifurca ochricompacta]
MSMSFPHVDISALKKFAAAAAAGEHTYRLSRNTVIGAPSSSGKKKGKSKSKVQDKKAPYPVVIGCEETRHVGEQMILITFDPNSVPLGPHSMLAHFPRGRPTYTTKALVGMTQIVRDHAQIIAPKIYGYYDNVPNPINAEVVLLELLPGECLEDIWMDLEPRQIMTICARLGELLVKLFNCRSPLLCSETDVPDSPPRTPASSAHYRRPILLAPPFDEGPLMHMEPQEALTSTHDYLLALVQRPERIFGGVTEAPAPLDEADVAVVRATWKNLGHLISYHSGGFYIPSSLSPEARFTAYSVLQSKEFGVWHWDMQMTRFVVRWARPGDVHSDATLALTGWEYAARAPLWSCARMPPWLYPHLHPFERITWEGQRNVRQFIFHSIFHGDFIPQTHGWEWVVAHVYGVTERWFEGLVSAHRGFQGATEVLLVRLREYWMRQRPDVPFPLDIDKTHLQDSPMPPAVATAMSPPEEHPVERGTEEDALLAHTRTFVEEVRLAMDALSGEIAAAQEVLYKDTLQRTTALDYMTPHCANKY